MTRLHDTRVRKLDYSKPLCDSLRQRESITPRVELIVAVADSKHARAQFPSFYMWYMCHITCIDQ